MGINWTGEQIDAINDRDKNILVAAAAGSGKTTILVERIKKLIIEEGTSLEEMLIVTFTNAAATKMKMDIEKAIRNVLLVEKDPDMIRRLKQEMSILPRANISTFHAFAMEVIRRFFYLIDREPNFKIGDEGQISILRTKAMDRLLEELHEDGKEDFYTFLNHHSGDRNDDAFREIVEVAYNKIQSLPEPFEWLREAVLSLEDGNTFLEKDFVKKYFWKEVEVLANKAVAIGSNNYRVGQDNYVTNLETVLANELRFMEAIANAVHLKDYDEVYEAVNNVVFESLTSGSFSQKNNPQSDKDSLKEAGNEIKNGRAKLKSILDVFKKNFFIGSKEDVAEGISLTAGDGKFLLKAVKRFSEIFKEEKEAKNLIDFNDIEHQAYEILSQNKGGEYYRNKFKHIFIDEYQDSNVLQEELISKICRSNNVFMVGDVKQSIYKFRLAEPEIFQGKYELFRENMALNPEDTEDKKIDLNMNFRSKKPIIDFVNAIFDNIMSGYDEAARLKQGNSYGGEPSYKPELVLINDKYTGEDPVDFAIENMKAAEREALAAVKLIKKYLGKNICIGKEENEKGQEVYKYRPLEKKDIVILLRSIKGRGEAYYRVLAENNIDAYVDNNEGYFDTLEIDTFMSLIKILDNPQQDIPLLTIMRSGIFDFTIDELANIRLLHREGSYYYSVVNYCHSGEDLALREKCIKTFENIDKWRQESKLLPLEEFIWKLLLDTNFYIHMGAMASGKQRQANLRILVEKALAYENSQEGSLYGFVKYIDAIKNETSKRTAKLAVGQAKLVGEGEDVVRIMTIHKSKGMEFPMVILGGYNSKLNYDTGGNLVFHKDIGIGLKSWIPNMDFYQKTLIQTLINYKIHQEEVEEQKRVLYVAMTRAMDILGIIGSVKNIDDVFNGEKEEDSSDTSYFNMSVKALQKIFDRGIGTVDYYSDGDLLEMYKEEVAESKRLEDLFEEAPKAVSDRVRAMLEADLSKPLTSEISAKSKYSVSELNKRVRVDLAEPKSFKVNRDFTKAQIGTITHKVLEKMNFSQAEDEGLIYIDKLVVDMVREEFLTDEEANTVDKNSLVNFAKSDLGRRIGNAEALGKLRREQTFNLRISKGDELWDELSRGLQAADENNITIQGVMDCLFEEDGYLVLVDYKTSDFSGVADFEVKKYELKETYEMQMKIYAVAAELALGKTVKDKYLYLTNIGQVVDMG